MDVRSAVQAGANGNVEGLIENAADLGRGSASLRKLSVPTRRAWSRWPNTS